MSDESEVMSTGDRLIYMANQIARNLAAQRNAEAETADHIRRYWTGDMRARLLQLAAERPDALSPVAAGAARRIAA
ncbi:formate dehydrogenase subunit delta [Sphingobium sp. CAP-1]|uniref:formate dehydrogenase subunit delta n=1 Tax=Sphingobium sp. CAP-1 TaxID=2676077 RepID=UPI0012BB45F6|nr:formate dehydrogenase subunit delta [Sphingobium sp. CAP-1]QGP79027.1 formate dehydrogenase [Sphingobium sp. CAP-1]